MNDSASDGQQSQRVSYLFCGCNPRQKTTVLPCHGAPAVPNKLRQLCRTASNSIFKSPRCRRTFLVQRTRKQHTVKHCTTSALLWLRFFGVDDPKFRTPGFPCCCHRPLSDLPLVWSRSTLGVPVRDIYIPYSSRTDALNTQCDTLFLMAFFFGPHGPSRGQLSAHALFPSLGCVFLH